LLFEHPKEQQAAFAKAGDRRTGTSAERLSAPQQA
jgi:hypothetical protein